MNRLNSLDADISSLCSADYINLSKRVKSGRFQFSYRFGSGQTLVGTVEGDVLINQPNLVFNLRHLNATLKDRHQHTTLSFDKVFGQFRLDQPEVLFSGSDSGSDSFFCFNYRGHEAIVFDGQQGCWVASGWSPDAWCVEATGAGWFKWVPCGPRGFQSSLSNHSG